MGVKLVSASAGSVEIVAPATASNYTATMPAGSGTVAVNGVSGTLVSGTAVASTSGTSIDFTSIPSWVKRITVMFQGVSTNGSSSIQVQLGTGSTPTYTTSGYLGASSALTGSTGSQENNGTGLRVVANIISSNVFHGSVSISNQTGNTWVLSGVLGQSDTTRINWAGGSIALAAVLTAVRITTVNGTDAFDAGSINILYE